MPADPAAPRFNVLTLNTHKGFAPFNRRFMLPELREAMLTLSADVVFLQEVVGSHARHARRHRNWPDASQYEYLAGTVWPQFAYGRNAVYTDGHHGNAVLSKFPIIAHHNHDVSAGRFEKRGCLHCTLRVPGLERDLHAICVHLSLYESQRLRQLDQLCRIVRDAVPADAPLLVAGDFNDWRGSAHAVLSNGAGLREAFVHAYGRAARSFPTRWPLLRLDRIYYRNAELTRPAVHARVPWSHLSDHAALSAQAQL